MAQPKLSGRTISIVIIAGMAIVAIGAFIYVTSQSARVWRQFVGG